MSTITRIFIDRRYPWERNRWESIGWTLRPRYRVAHYTSALSAIYSAANSLLYPYGFTPRERREMVRSYIENAVTYLGMAVSR